MNDLQEQLEIFGIFRRVIYCPTAIFKWIALGGALQHQYINQ